MQSKKMLACQLLNYSDNKQYIQSNQIHVEVHDYLPSLSYPKCHISPSTTLYDKSEATFHCMVGESSVSLSYY